MSKKGFTLIELLAVITILSVIAVIAYPKVFDIIGASRLSVYNSSKKTIIESAKLKYLSDVNTGVVTEYTVSDLIESGYIKSGAKNPLTDEDYSSNTKVLITNIDGTISYEYVEGNTLYDLISLKTESDNVYSKDNEYIYMGENSQNYVTFNKETYRIIKIDKYRHVYLVKETDEEISEDEIEDYVSSYYNDNFDESSISKLYGSASIITLDLYNQTLVNNSTYINVDNNSWIKVDNEYKVITMNSEYVDVDSARAYIVVILNNNVIVSSGSGSQLDPYVLE